MRKTFGKSGVDNLPLNTVKLLKQVTAYQEPMNNRRNRQLIDPQHPGIALVESGGGGG